MRQNNSQTGNAAANGRTYLPNDWFNGGIPGNVVCEPHVYIESSYSFGAFGSKQPAGLLLKEGSGCYDSCCFITGEDARISVGRYTILNSTTLVSYKEITIGNHCMLAWSAIITDTWLPAASASVLQRQAILMAAAASPDRLLPAFAEPKPVVLEDNCWIGFGAIVLPGVRIGRGAVVGSKTIISEDVPPYAVVVGNPAKIVRYLHPDDTEEAKAQAFAAYMR